MQLGDVIFALASARGPSGHALLRASGPGAFDVLRHIAPECELAKGPPRRGAGHSVLELARGVRLPARVMTFAAPSSFTGENAFELIVAGGVVAPRAVFERLRSIQGTRASLPGEFSARAYLNVRLSAAEAEALPAVIGARTHAEVFAARAGAASGPWSHWMDQTAHLLALVESGIDFVDQEDVRPIEPGDLRQAISAIRAEMEAFRARGAGQAYEGEPVVVLCGRPSAGKSSLFNALVGHGSPDTQRDHRPGARQALARALVHEEPGTTRDALAAPLDAGAGRWVTLVDTPGVDEVSRTPGSPEDEAQRAAREAARRARVLVWCDPHGLGPEEARLRVWARREDERGEAQTRVLVRTKADRPGTTPEGWIGVCPFDGRGLGPLKEAIARAASSHPAIEEERPTERQSQAVLHALAELDEALALTLRTDPGPGEIIAEHLRDTLRTLGEITRPMGVDEVLGRIFARSCIGK